MRSKVAILALAAAGLVFISGARADEEKGEVKTPFDQVPAAVRDTLTRESGGAKIESVDKETDSGKAVYEADVLLDGKNWEIKVGEDGKVVSKKLDSEEDEKAEKGEHHGKMDKDEEDEDHHGERHDKDGDDEERHVERHFPGHIIVEVRFDDGPGDDRHGKHHDKDEEGDEHHDGHHDQDGEEHHGKHHEEDEGMKVAMGEVPAPVKATLERHAAGATLPGQVEKEEKDGTTEFEAHVQMDGKPYEIKIAGDGTLLSMKLHDEQHGKKEDEDDQGGKR